MSYDKYKGKILSRVFKGASKDRKDFYKVALNRRADVAMKTTFKSNKLQIMNIEMTQKREVSDAKKLGWPKPKMSWIDLSTLKILKSVNRSKRAYARRKNKK